MRRRLLKQEEEEVVVVVVVVNSVLLDRCKKAILQGPLLIVVLGPCMQ